jgi:hypothetical protein
MMSPLTKQAQNTVLLDARRLAKTRQHMITEGNVIKDKTGQDRSRQDKTRQDKTG